MNSKLHFSNGNAKLKGIWIFNLPAGWSCPFAKKCRSHSDRETGKIQDGDSAEFRCYAASAEAIYPKLRALLWRNWEELRGKSAREMAQIIDESLPSRMRGQIYRIHSHGDFFNQDYFDAWMEVAMRYPKIRFYAYTKAVPFWVKRLHSIPRNFVLNASKGGSHDHLIEKHKLKFAEVVFDPSDAKKKKNED